MGLKKRAIWDRNIYAVACAFWRPPIAATLQLLVVLLMWVPLTVGILMVTPTFRPSPRPPLGLPQNKPVKVRNKSRGWSGGGGECQPRGGALTLVLGTHCKTDSRSCGCRLEKGGAVTDPRTLRRGAVRGAFPVGAAVVSLASPRKASWISYN